MFRQKTVIAGNTIEVARGYVLRSDCPPGRRRKKSNSTPDWLKKINDWKSGEKLRQTLNTNFQDGDSYCTLTYEAESAPKSLREAKHDISLALRQLKYCTQKNNLNLKYVYVFGAVENGYHIHMVINIPKRCSLIQEHWKHGHVYIEPLSSNGQYSHIAYYMLENSKEAQEYAEQHGEKMDRKYNPSRNLVKPEVKEEVISERKCLEALPDIDGYYIDKETVNSGISRLGYPFSRCTYIGLRDQHTKDDDAYSGFPMHMDF